MANTLKNITITKNSVIIDDKTGGKFMLLANTFTASFIIIMGVQKFNVGGLTIISGIMIGLGSLLLALTFFMTFKISHKKTFTLDEIESLKDKTAFTGHRSLRLYLKNGRYRNLYLEAAAIPMVIKEMNTYEIKVK